CHAVAEDFGKPWYSTPGMPQPDNSVHATVKSLSANIGQCFHQRRGIAHLQFKPLFLSGCMAIVDKNATFIRAPRSFTDIQYSFSKDSMIPTKRLRQKHQVEWEMRAHVQVISRYDYPLQTLGCGQSCQDVSIGAAGAPACVKTGIKKIRLQKRLRLGQSIKQRAGA